MAVVPTAAATALDIDLSNISIVFISVSFATMVRCFLHQQVRNLICTSSLKNYLPDNLLGYRVYLLVSSSRVVLISPPFKVFCSDCCLIQDATPNLLAAGDGLCNF